MYTPIRAAGHGKVVFVGKSPWDPAWIVIIAHSQHLVSWYGHVDNKSHPPKVKEGQYVAKGQVLAFNGHDRLDDRPPPPLGRPDGRDLGQPAALPPALAAAPGEWAQPGR